MRLSRHLLAVTTIISHWFGVVTASDYSFLDPAPRENPDTPSNYQFNYSFQLGDNVSVRWAKHGSPPPAPGDPGSPAIQLQFPSNYDHDRNLTICRDCATGKHWPCQDSIGSVVFYSIRQLLNTYLATALIMPFILVFHWRIPKDPGEFLTHPEQYFDNGMSIMAFFALGYYSDETFYVQAKSGIFTVTQKLNNKPSVSAAGPSSTASSISTPKSNSASKKIIGAAVGGVMAAIFITSVISYCIFKQKTRAHLLEPRELEAAEKEQPLELSAEKCIVELSSNASTQIFELEGSCKDSGSHG